MSLPRATILDARMTPLTFERTQSQARLDGVESIWIEWTRGVGGNRLDTGKGEVLGGPGAVTTTDLSRPFVRKVANADFISVRLDRALLGETVIEAMHGTNLTGPRARMIGDFFQSVAGGTGPIQPAVLENTLAAVIAATVASSADRADEAASVLGPVALDQARRYIGANLHREGVSIEEVVASTGVSRATLYRLFAPFGGLARFMWSQRLDRARQAICEPSDGRSLVVIAEAHGFSDPAHFTRAFKAEFGIRPSDLRAFL